MDVTEFEWPGIKRKTHEKRKMEKKEFANTFNLILITHFYENGF